MNETHKNFKLKFPLSTRLDLIMMQLIVLLRGIVFSSRENEVRVFVYVCVYAK